MDWIRANYDRTLLIAAALILLFSGISIWRNAAGLSANFPVTPPAAAQRSALPPGKAAELQASVEKLHQPPQWTFAGTSGLFVPSPYFIGPNGQPAAVRTTMLHPPVPNEWLQQFGLPMQDADVLDQDPDGDGFTNLDEWAGHTNPTDAKSHPDYLTKLKLKSFTQEPFRLVFSSWVGDTFAINTIDLKQPTQFLKIGDMIPGTQFKIMKFEEKYQPNQYGTNVDVSELTLRHQETGEELKLIKEQVAMSPESVATLVYNWPAGSPSSAV